MFETEMGKAAAKEIRKAARPPTEQELRTAQILATLDELGGKQVGQDSVVFTGTQIVLPADMAGKMDEVVAFLEEFEESENAHFNIKRKYNYRPNDVWAAFDRAMKKVFGVSGIGKAQFSMFGVEPPEYVSVASGPHGETIQVPSGKVAFSLLDANFFLEATRHPEFGIIGMITCDAPKKNRTKVEGFFKVVQQELVENSIYRGKAITAHPSEPQFLNLDAIDPARVIYTEQVEDQLRVNLWAPLQYTDTLRANKIPLKRAVLLYGPNGTGKTLAGGLAALLATQNGWTYILVRAEDDALEALTTARMYSPAVVMIEDLDTVASANQQRDQIKLVLDRLDNVEAKGAEVMAIFTTNEAADLDRNVVRPGRLDVVIEVKELDRQGYERLVKALIAPEKLETDKNGDSLINYDEVCAALEGFLPAFATEAIQRSMRYSIMENHGEPGIITTKNLVDAARGMATHIALMDAASRAVDKRPALETVLAGVVQDALSDTAGKFVAIEGDASDIHSVFQNVQVEYAKDGK
jgi:transitional endoplasmic reticulum ATPase